MTIVVPNTGSIFASSGCVPSSCNCWAWIGLATTGASGSCTWYRTSAGSTSGCEIMPISLVAQQSALFGPFNAPCGLYVGGMACGFAVAWIKYPPGT